MGFVNVELQASPVMTPEQRLWFSVLAQAARDAMGNIVIADDQLRRERMEAKGWFDWGGRDFRMVSALAGLDAGAVHEAWRAGKFTTAKMPREGGHG